MENTRGRARGTQRAQTRMRSQRRERARAIEAARMMERWKGRARPRRQKWKQPRRKEMGYLGGSGVEKAKFEDL